MQAKGWFVGNGNGKFPPNSYVIEGEQVTFFLLSFSPSPLLTSPAHSWGKLISVAAAHIKHVIAGCSTRWVEGHSKHCLGHPAAVLAEPKWQYPAEHI